MSHSTPLPTHVIRCAATLLAGAMLSCILLLGAGCDSKPVEKGVVAKVNGEPVFLAELEAEYDLLHLSWAGAVSPTVGKLRREYGQLLAGLIVQKLVYQELEAHGLSITEEEVDEAVDKVKADYPEGEFDRVLIEEYIDINVWREQLRAHLAVKKLMDEVLRPTISLDFQEADAYYREHLQDLVIPARVHFLLLAASNKEVVEEATALFMENRDMDKVMEAFPGITIQELNIREDRLPTNWNYALTEIVSGDASPAMAGMGGFESVILLERVPQKNLDTSQAYPLIEKILFDAKLQKAFANWLADKTASSEILITSHLHPTTLAEEEEEDVVADADQMAEELGLDPVEAEVDLVNPDLGYGRLWVVTEPAEVVVKVLDIGPAFEQGMELDARPYNVELSLEGYQTQKERVDVFLGQDTILRVKMTKKGQGEPLAAIVELLPIGEDPPDIQSLALPAEDGDIPEVDQEIDFGRIFVTTDPEGGAIRITNIGPKFRQGMELDEGVYDLEVSLEGYIQQEYRVEILPGQDTLAHFVLTRVGQGEPHDPLIEMKPIGDEGEEGQEPAESETQSE